MKRSPMPARAEPMRRCGKRYADEAAALRSKDVVQHGGVPHRCWHGCGGYHVTLPAVPSETGFSPAVLLLVRTRAGMGDPRYAICESCGQPLGEDDPDRGQVQHRLARGMGGCADEIVNSAANAALLCGDPFSGCHGEAERRSSRMEARGFWIRHGTGEEYDPRFVPVRRFTLAGRVTAWLAADGSYQYAPGAAA